MVREGVMQLAPEGPRLQEWGEQRGLGQRDAAEAVGKWKMGQCHKREAGENSKLAVSQTWGIRINRRLLLCFVVMRY